MSVLSKYPGKTRCKFNCCRSDEAAFTLIEMMIVLVVIIALTSLALPSVGSILTGRTLSGSIDRSWSAFSAARQQAIARQTPVALVLANGRQNATSNKSDAFILLAAKAPQPDTTTWGWVPASAWIKLPHGVQVDVGQNVDTPEPSFLTNRVSTSPTALPSPAPSSTWPASFMEITKNLPALEGDVLDVTQYCFVVFHPDGTVDSHSNPYIQFKRFHAGTQAAEAALVLSPDSGRPRLVQN